MMADEASMSALSEEWQSILAQAERAINADERSMVAGWETLLALMAAETASLKADGLWRSGPRTMLGALGLQDRELPLVAGLAWILTPEGHHGLGDLVLASWLSRFDVPYEPSLPISVRLEESRRDHTGATRADMVIRAGTQCMLLEAKVYSIDHHAQCDRLARLWAPERPALVYLTRWGEPPTEAPESQRQWRRLAWSDVADIIDAAIQQRRPAAGVADYLLTLRHYHGRMRFTP
jgi:hypothetical protein